MCGFIGRINTLQPNSAGMPLLSAGLRFLSRRGPDSNREWASGDGQVELLHARLAIVDTDSRAHQPFTDVKNGITVVFNGEIYNYLDLRAELSDYEFRTKSDTEVIIALYVTRGLAGLRKLRGMFGLVIIDAQARRVYLARDPIGKKPLFLAQWSSGSYFGSSVMALLAASGEDARIVQNGVTQFWEHGHVEPYESLVAGCSPVIPGQVVELDWHGAVLRVDSCTPSIESEQCGDVETARERVSELILQSVKRRLSNNPKPVSLLSGGVDSTVVTSKMKEAIGGAAITLGSFLPGANDEKYARFAGKRIEIPLQVVRARSKNLAEDVLWALDLQDEPLGMISFFPLALMIRAAKDYGKILLTGDGGDEVFLGYGKPDDWLRKVEDEDQPVSEGKNSLSPLPLPEWMSTWGKAMVTQSLLGHMFTKLDRASAEQGVEARCPLLDWDLVSFVRSLSPDILFFDGRPKALLKSQLVGWPNSFIDRPKMGFTYNLRWQWGSSRFNGLRELVTREAVETFSSQLPEELGTAPENWKSMAIFKNFQMVWKLLAWTRFTERLRVATTVTQDESRFQSAPAAALASLSSI
jgi:asparagine synthase (glutamine-hydrolysing)